MASPARSASRTSRSAKTQKAAASGIPNPTIEGVPLSELAEVNGKSAGPRSKRAAIIQTAVAQFGEIGYEATKWAQIADEVGIGQTALYHYFESKAHCLLTIMRLELARSHQRYLVIAAEARPPVDTLRSALTAAFQVSPAEVSQLRVLMANGDILGNPRPSEREESERRTCLALSRRIEESWTDLMKKVIAANKGDNRDAKLMALLILGLINSAWRWFRVGGKVTVAELSELYVDAALRAVG